MNFTSGSQPAFSAKSWWYNVWLSFPKADDVGINGLEREREREGERERDGRRERERDGGRTMCFICISQLGEESRVDIAQRQKRELVPSGGGRVSTIT